LYAGLGWYDPSSLEQLGSSEHCMAILTVEHVVIAARGVAATLTEDALERDRAPPPPVG
jgi:hypothetical protein